MPPCSLFGLGLQLQHISQSQLSRSLFGLGPPFELRSCSLFAAVLALVGHSTVSNDCDAPGSSVILLSAEYGNLLDPSYQPLYKVPSINKKASLCGPA